MRKVIEWIKKFFVDDDFNKRMENLEFSEEIKKDSRSVVPKSFTDTLLRKGFTYNSNNKRWSRTWTAKTRDAEERALEVYEQKEDGEWVSLMYGNEGDLFYEQSVGYGIN